MDENLKSRHRLDPSMLKYDAVLKYENDKDLKQKELKERIAPFENVSTLKEAKALAEKILPTAKEQTSFYIGEFKCVVVNRDDLLRISIDSSEEFLCYEFV